MSRTAISAACLLLALQAGAVSAEDKAPGSSVYIGVVTGEPERNTFGYRVDDLALPAAVVHLEVQGRYLGRPTGDEEKDTFARVAQRGAGDGRRPKIGDDQPTSAVLRTQ